MLGMLVQRFEFVDHLHYQLKTKTTLTVKPDDFHILVRPRAGRPDRTDRPRADAPPPACRPTAPATAAAPPGRPARDAAVGAVRLEPRHGGVDRHQARAGGHRARLRRHPRRAGRPRRRPPADGGAVLIVCSSYNGTAPGQRRRLLHAGSAAPADGAADGRRLHRLRLRQHRVGRDLPGRADAARRRSSPPTAAAGSATVARATRQATSTPPTATGTAASGPTWPPPWTCPPRWARPRPRRPAAVDHADQPAGHQPGHRLLRGAARAPCAANRELIGGTNGKPRGAVDAAHRDRPDRRRRLPDGRPPRGAAAQRRRPRPPGDHPVRARRRPVRHDHPEQRLAHPPADRRARPAARGARQLRGAAGRREPRRHRHPRPPHRRTPAQQAALEALAGRRRYRDQVYAPEPVAARPAGGLPGLRAAVRGVPRHAAAAAPALLLHLLLAAGQPGRLQHHRRRAARPGPLRRPARSPGSARATWRSCRRTAPSSPSSARRSIAFRPAGEPAHSR